MDLRHLWSVLKDEAPSGDTGFRLTLLESLTHVRLFAGVAEPTLSPALVIELPRNVWSLRHYRMSTRAFEAVAADFRGLSSGRFGIGIVLLEREYEDLFSHFVADIAHSIRGTSDIESIAPAITRCVERWRRFLEGRRAPLSESQLCGLVGELSVLARLLSRYEMSHVLECWKAPAGGLRDFESCDWSIEVRTLQSSHGAAIRISDPAQIESGFGGDAFLAVVHVARREPIGKTLPEVVTEISAKLDDMTKNTFEGKLADSGYLAIHASQYPQRFVARAPEVYQIREGFPRIASADVPPGVTNVGFSVSLAGIARFQTNLTAAIGPSGLSIEIGNGDAD